MVPPNVLLVLDVKNLCDYSNYGARVYDHLPNILYNS